MLPRLDMAFVPFDLCPWELKLKCEETSVQIIVEQGIYHITKDQSIWFYIW